MVFWQAQILRRSAVQAIDVVAPGGKIALAVQGAPEAYAGIGKGQLKSVSLHWGEHPHFLQRHGSQLTVDGSSCPGFVFSK
jgi:hypothetical protein